jgi:hypothetical protein
MWRSTDSKKAGRQEVGTPWPGVNTMFVET